jgi:hypothetical protein
VALLVVSPFVMMTAEGWRSLDRQLLCRERAAGSPCYLFAIPRIGATLLQLCIS